MTRKRLVPTHQVADSVLAEVDAKSAADVAARAERPKVRRRCGLCLQSIVLLHLSQRPDCTHHPGVRCGICPKCYAHLLPEE